MREEGLNINEKAGNIESKNWSVEMITRGIVVHAGEICPISIGQGFVSLDGPSGTAWKRFVESVPIKRVPTRLGGRGNMGELLYFLEKDRVEAARLLNAIEAEFNENCHQHEVEAKYRKGLKQEDEIFPFVNHGTREQFFAVITEMRRLGGKHLCYDKAKNQFYVYWGEKFPDNVSVENMETRTGMSPQFITWL